MVEGQSLGLTLPGVPFRGWVARGTQLTHWRAFERNRNTYEDKLCLWRDQKLGRQALALHVKWLNRTEGEDVHARRQHPDNVERLLGPHHHVHARGRWHKLGLLSKCHPELLQRLLSHGHGIGVLIGALANLPFIARITLSPPLSRVPEPTLRVDHPACGGCPSVGNHLIRKEVLLHKLH